MKKRVSTIQELYDFLQTHMVMRGEFDKRFKEINKEMDEIKTDMVTKSFLEDKLADLEGNVILRQRKEDKKVNLIINFLEKRKILNPSEIRALREIKVFPHQI